MYKLRELERKDMAVITTWRNKPELIALLGAPFRYINCDVDEKWFDAYMSARDSSVRCVIVEVDGDDAPIGLVSLIDINHINRSGVFHIMIGDACNHNKGAGFFALNEMLYHAFYNLNLNRVELSVLPNNERAIHLYEKVGFVKEGIKRKSVYKKGVYMDMLYYAILKEEYVR